MRKYTVTVREEGCGAFIFKGIEANNKNAACREGIDTYMIFLEETEIGSLTAVATIEKEVA